MKKIIIPFIVIIGLVHSVSGQIVCGYNPSNPTRYTGSGHITNGGVFTPKGDLHVLIVFISYGEPYDSQEVDEWPVDSPFPNWATSTEEKAFYTSYSEFSNNIYSDNNRFSVSNFYYQMSQGNFRLIADYYPQRVVVNVSRTDDWGDIHRKAIQQIKDHVNWSLYDNRRNSPSYQFDNSTFNPDGIIDYIVFCHRFSWDWTDKPSERLSSKDANGYSTTSLNYDMNNGYSVNHCGFSFLTGGSKPMGIFPHELGHELYDGPHYAGGNNVAGNYFYEPVAGWGMMHLSQSYACATGWERYILDWIPQIKASGINSDINSSSDLSATNGIFTLRDFITTGDAIRIRVPAKNGVFQYLWIENHQCLSTFDGNIHGSSFCDSEIDEYKNGVVAYVESYSHVKEGNFISLFYNGNGIRWLSRQGDYDFIYDRNSITPGALCHNETYPFFQEKANPMGGQGAGELIRHDYNNDGYIMYNGPKYGSIHNTAYNECKELIQLNNGIPNAKYYTGTGLQFNVGDVISICRNPCVKNIPEYNSNIFMMGDYFINGISVEVLSRNPDGSMVVKVRIDDVEINKNVRWAASSIVLTDITGNNLPDVDVQSSITVDIDKSGTPNRHKNPANLNQTSSNIDDFITPTTFTCRSGSFFKQESASTVNVKNSSSLVLEAGSLYEVENGAVLNILATGTFHVKSGATLRVKNTGHVEIQSGAYICIEDGANIELVDELSAINLRQGYQLGLNPEIFSGQSNCTAVPLVNFPLTTGSEGYFHEFSGNRFIQDTTYYGNAYETGNAIRAGRDVTTQKPYGDVILENGSHVIMDAENDVLLKSGVSVKQGAILEVR